MNAEPSAQGPYDPTTVPRHEFAARDPLFLPHLLPYNRCRGTRFADCRHRSAPVDPARLAVLLEACGYDTRMGDVLEMRGAHGQWLPAPHVLPSAPMPVLGLLRYVCERDCPVRVMDPNDTRLKSAFDDRFVPPFFRAPRRPEPAPEQDAEPDDGTGLDEPGWRTPG
jgi:hypothetical protein